MFRKAILVTLCTFAIMYGFFAFVLADLNAFNWGADNRSLYLLLSTHTAAVAALFTL